MPEKYAFFHGFIQEDSQNGIVVGSVSGMLGFV